MPEPANTGDFDFDDWAELARSNPEAFEINRLELIEQAILAAPPRNQARLRRLQWKLDAIRDTAPSPLAACIRMQELMWESVLGEDGLLARLQQLPPQARPRRTGAQVLEFRQ